MLSLSCFLTHLPSTSYFISKYFLVTVSGISPNIPYTWTSITELSLSYCTMDKLIPMKYSFSSFLCSSVQICFLTYPFKKSLKKGTIYIILLTLELVALTVIETNNKNCGLAFHLDMDMTS